MLSKFKNYKIYVLYGGNSPEREISIKTGENIYSALKNKNLDVTLIDIKSPEELDSQLIKNNAIFFIGLHGGFGEDGTIQKLFEDKKAYFTGSGSYSSRVCMNKYLTKKIVQEAGINTPLFLHFKINDINKLNMVGDVIGFPLVIKPVNLGSSIGIKICKNFNQLKEAINFIKNYDNEFLIEQFLSGEEITVSVLRDRILPPIRLKYQGEIFDYANKYDKTKNVEYEFIDTHYKNIDALSLKIFKSLQCYSYARIDYRSDGNSLYLLEVNTLPGFTQMSLVPKSAQKCGIEFDELLFILLEDALNRYHDG